MRNSIKFTALGFIVFALLMAIPTEPADATDNPAASLLALINEYRAANGCAPLVVDRVLTGIARRHGTDMAIHGYFAHTAPDGSELRHRLRNAGYLFAVAAENLARGYRDAATVMAGWRHSPRHDRNLLRTDVSRAGIGVVRDASGGAGPVWVLVLAHPYPR